MSFWKKNDSLGIDTPASTQTEPAILNGSTPKEERPLVKMDAAPAFDMSLPVEDRLEQRYGKARSALGSGTVIQGKLSFDTPVRIDGKLGGEIFSSKALIVGPTGSVNAEVQVAALVVMGSMTGNIVAADRVEVLKGGRVDGNITAPVIFIEEGAVFNGQCSMQSALNSAAGQSKESINRTPKSAEPQKGERAPLKEQPASPAAH